MIAVVGTVQGLVDFDDGVTGSWISTGHILCSCDESKAYLDAAETPRGFTHCAIYGAETKEDCCLNSSYG